MTNRKNVKKASDPLCCKNFCIKFKASNIIDLHLKRICFYTRLNIKNVVLHSKLPVHQRYCK